MKSDLARERPIPFSGPMVRAILEDRKTQTRRPIKPQPFATQDRRCPFGVPGDRLWVRETFRVTDTLDFEAYRADIGTARWNPVVDPVNCKWRPAIFMPRSMSRITLEITEIRVERIQQISDEDANAEGRGIVWGEGCRYRSFSGLWDSINAKRGYSWESNPWVWAITFRRIA